MIRPGKALLGVVSAFAALGVASAGPSARAQSKVVVHSALDESATGLVRELLEKALPELELVLRGAELGATPEDRDLDVLCGVEGLRCQWAPEGLLASYDSPRARGLRGPHRGSDSRYVVPWLSPWMLVYDAGKWPGGDGPKKIEELLFDRRFRGEVVLVEPEGAPSLWLGWVGHEVARGHGTERVLAWLRTLDASVQSYHDSIDGVLSALQRGAGSIALLPPGHAPPAPRSSGLVSVLPGDGTPVAGLAVALTRRGRGSAAAVRVYDELVSSAFALGMVGAGLVPAPREGLPAAQLPPSARSTRRGSWPYAPDGASAQKWFTAWRDTVRDRGREFAGLELALDAVFAVVFLVFIFFVYRHLKTSEAKEQP